MGIRRKNDKGKPTKTIQRGGKNIGGKKNVGKNRSDGNKQGTEREGEK